VAERIPVVILCGGAGTRLAEQTEIKPKPLVEIGGRPIVWHIMKHYSRYGFTEFVLALGHKGDLIKRYFLDYRAVSNDLTISLQDGGVTPRSNGVEPWTVHLIDTGESTLTGGRLKQLAPLIGQNTFMLTYGDGVSDVPLDRLLAFHRSRGCLVTLTAVRPPARFGAIEFDADDRIRHFKEKSTLHEGWINGGFSVVEPGALDYIEADVMWEHAPLEGLAREGQLVAYRHEQFWQCMDTLRDLRYLESLWDAGHAPWKTWS
jgi:glucose-1-phosphate cytidylyltransferase